MMDAQVREVLDRLEQRSRSEQPRLTELRALGPPAVRAAAKDLMLDVGRDAGEFLNAIVLLTRAHRIVEIGGSVGYSTLWLAEAARKTQGTVVSYEIDPLKHDQQRRNLESAGLLHQVDLRVTDATDLWAAPDPEPLDLVFFDHWPKSSFVSYFDRIWPRIREGGAVLADNMLRPPISLRDTQAYQAHVRGIANARTTIIDVGKGFAVSVKI